MPHKCIFSYQKLSVVPEANETVETTMLAFKETACKATLTWLSNATITREAQTTRPLVAGHALSGSRIALCRFNASGKAVFGTTSLDGDGGHLACTAKGKP